MERIDGAAISHVRKQEKQQVAKLIIVERCVKGSQSKSWEQKMNSFSTDFKVF